MHEQKRRKPNVMIVKKTEHYVLLQPKRMWFINHTQTIFLSLFLIRRF